METFSALLALCMGNSSVTGEFPSQRPVMQSFDIIVMFTVSAQDTILYNEFENHSFKMTATSRRGQ